MFKIPQAKLISEVPKQRYRVSTGARAPKIGDILELDQGFTGKDGKAMILAYHTLANGKDSYEIDVYETEIKLLN